MHSYLVKIQRALAPVPDSEILVYNQDAKIFVTFTPPPPEILAIMGDAPKIYAHAVLETDGTLRLLERAPDQDW